MPPTPRCCHAEQTREDFGWNHIFGAVMGVAPLCKHPGFAEEREWRLLFGPVAVKEVESVHFVERRHTLAPYIEFRLAEGDNVLDDIQWIAGPGPQQERANSRTRDGRPDRRHDALSGDAQPHALPALARILH